MSYSTSSREDGTPPKHEAESTAKARESDSSISVNSTSSTGSLLEEKNVLETAVPFRTYTANSANSTTQFTERNSEERERNKNGSKRSRILKRDETVIEHRGRSRSISPNNQPKINPRKTITDKHVKENYHNVMKRVHAVLTALPTEISHDIDNKIGLSLSGCGFLGSYHFGVIICFQQHAKKLMSRITHVAGASVGSLVAALIVLAPHATEDGLLQLYELADEINANSLGAMAPGFYLAERLSRIVDRFLPDDISPANGRLHVSVTRQSNYENRIVSEFPSRVYLLRCLNASCYIPLYSMGCFAKAPELDGGRYIDGGYSNNLPIFDNIPTITISPFSGSAIIAPTDRSPFDWKMRIGNQVMKVNLQNVVRGAQSLFPPSTVLLKAYYEMGYRDAMRFLIGNNLFEREEGTEL